MQHEVADKEVEFFKTTCYYRNAYEAYLKDDIQSTKDHANVITLQGKAQGDEVQKSKDQNIKNNLSKKEARKCVCEDIHEYKECSYIVSSARKSD
jgi:hypothetical protein